MPKTPRRLQSNFSKGELSPTLDGRPDLAAYFEGARTLENWMLLRQGGVTRRPGLRFICEVKDSTQDTILLPFESSVDTAYVLEVGNQYARVIKDKARVPISAGGAPVEMVTPWTTAQLRQIHFTQSVDVLYAFHPDLQQQTIRRASDTDWSVSAIASSPPPSYVADTDISRGASAGADATLTPGATTGSNVVCTASQAVFLTADVGRQIIAGTARAVITGLGVSAGDTTSPNANVRVDILDAFADTDPIAAGDWLLRISPQATLTPGAKEPAGILVLLTAGQDAFRAADVGKYIKVFGGLIQVTAYASATSATGLLLRVLTDAKSPPDACPAGAWTLEVASWSAARGYPRTGEFFQGRLYQASTPSQPTTFWGSKSNDYENYAIGALADDAVEYTMASRQLNRIEWLTNHKYLFLGTSGAEAVARGSSDQPLGGNNLPQVDGISREGCAPVQPIVRGRDILFLDRSLTKLFVLIYNFYVDNFDPDELTALADHIFGSAARLGPIAFRVRKDPTLFIVRSDGQLVTLTYYPQHKVIGFTRMVTDGAFEAVACIPGPTGESDRVYAIVRRTIDGSSKRYVELFDEHASELTARAWTQLHTDSAITYGGSAATTITGLSHLEGKTVEVIGDGGTYQTAVVAGGQITLDLAVSQAEVGLPMTSTLHTMRPAAEGLVIDGLPRAWDMCWTRVKDSRGGTVQLGSHAQPHDLPYPPGTLDTAALFSGALHLAGEGWDDDENLGNDGSVKIVADKPFPMTVLAIFGDLVVGQHG